MQAISAIIASAVVATAEICANPVDDGRGDPPFCRLNAAQRIETPCFSVMIDPQFLVSIDQDGRRMFLRFSQHQNQAGLNILAVPIDRLLETDQDTARAVNGRARDYFACSVKLLGATSWELCREASDEDSEYPRYYFLETPQIVYVITHYSSEAGRALTPAIDQLLETIIVHGI
jgi:hypothetical protein